MVAAQWTLLSTNVLFDFEVSFFSPEVDIPFVVASISNMSKGASQIINESIPDMGENYGQYSIDCHTQCHILTLTSLIQYLVVFGSINQIRSRRRFLRQLTSRPAQFMHGRHSKTIQ